VHRVRSSLRTRPGRAIRKGSIRAGGYPEGGGGFPLSLTLSFRTPLAQRLTSACPAFDQGLTSGRGRGSRGRGPCEAAPASPLSPRPPRVPKRGRRASCRPRALLELAPATAGHTLVKRWANAGQTLVKRWSNAGQTLVRSNSPPLLLVKYWSNSCHIHRPCNGPPCARLRDLRDEDGRR
jgi:hypothetical protein